MLADPSWNISYGLTPEGGKVWESFADPNWDRFIDELGPTEDADGSAYISANKAHLERYLESFDFVPGERGIEPGSLKWDILQPWQATYWKSLPLGHRARFRRRPQPERSSLEEEYREDIRQDMIWHFFSIKMAGWYGWP